MWEAVELWRRWRGVAAGAAAGLCVAVAVAVAQPPDGLLLAVVGAAVAGGAAGISAVGWRRSRARMAAVADLASGLDGVTGPAELAECVLRHAAAGLRAARGEVILWDQGGAGAHLRAVLAGGQVRLQTGPLPDAEVRALQAAASRPPRVQLVPAAGHPLRTYLSRRQLRSALLVPLHADGTVSGLLLIGGRARSAGHFKAHDLTLAEVIARHAGNVLRAAELRAKSACLTVQATTDDLTGLANRRSLLRHAQAAVADSGCPAAMLLIDLDGFKAVNDGFGHLIGDDVLRGVGERLRTTVPAGGVVARLGGDEFAVLLPDTSEVRAAVSQARRILLALRAPIIAAGHRHRVGASLGVAVAGPGADALHLLRAADRALYTAKRRGKGCVAWCHEEATHHLSGQPDDLVVVADTDGAAGSVLRGLTA